MMTINIQSLTRWAKVIKPANAKAMAQSEHNQRTTKEAVATIRKQLAKKGR